MEWFTDWCVLIVFAFGVLFVFNAGIEVFRPRVEGRVRR